MPSVVRAATGTELPILSGLVVASLTFAAAVAVVALRKLSAENMFVLGTVALTTGVMLTLVGVESQNVGIMLFGTVVSGVGFGTVYSGTLRSLLPYALPGKRAGLLAAFFVEGYLSFSLPALAAGFLAPVIGLTRTADFYGVGVILLAATSLILRIDPRLGN